MQIESRFKLLLLKLRICQGIGVRGEHLVYQWITDHQNESAIPTVDQLMEIAHLKPKFKKRFKEHFTSRELLAELRYNVKHAKYKTILDDDYPLLLKESYLPPNVLFYYGDWHLTAYDLLAVVGSRQSNDYTETVLKGLLPPILKKRIVIVSGLAKGADRVSHEVAINCGGKTIAVIGTGLDCYYPRDSQWLQRKIGQEHLLISEYPLGTGVSKYRFPERNRIIAGLVKSVLIVQAKKRSGSLITANYALDNNRSVLAVPGPINSALSVGCNELIAEGATPILTAKDIENEFHDLTI